MKHVTTVLAALVFCASAQAAGPKDEFHDMAWGSKPTTTMQYVDTVRGVERYRETDGHDLIVLGVETSRVFFNYVKGSFCGAEVHWNGLTPERRQIVWNRLAQYWGPGGKKDPQTGARSWLSETGQTLGVYQTWQKGDTWDVAMTLTALKCPATEAAGH